MGDITEAPGILTIDSGSNSSTLSLKNQIPQQVMRLKRVRLEMSSAATALAQKIVYVDLPFLSNQQLIDGVNGRFYLPILLDNAAVTSYTCDLPIYMSRHVHDTIELNVRSADGSLVSNFVHVALQFEFGYGHTS